MLPATGGHLVTPPLCEIQLRHQRYPNGADAGDSADEADAVPDDGPLSGRHGPGAPMSANSISLRCSTGERWTASRSGWNISVGCPHALLLVVRRPRESKRAGLLAHHRRATTNVARLEGGGSRPRRTPPHRVACLRCRGAL